MEIRRVQMTGGSSFIITLPKDWVKKSNIEKNDPIGLIAQSDGTLLLTPKMTRDGMQKIKEFTVDDRVNQNFLFRRLIAAYIAGYNTIKIKSKNRTKPETRVTVRKFTQTTIGQEIVEETDNSITIKDLLNPAEMPFHRTIKRMHIMVKGMYEDAIHALKNNDKKLAEDIINRDNEVDRLHWLVARQHNIILQNVNFAEKMQTTIGNSSTSHLISKILERIGDHTIRISNNITNLINKKIDPQIIKEIEQAANLSLEILNKSIGAYSKKDIKEANQNIEEVKKIENKCDKIINLAQNTENTITASIDYIAESIRRIGEYSEDISENVINYLISEEKK